MHSTLLSFKTSSLTRHLGLGDYKTKGLRSEREEPPRLLSLEIPELETLVKVFVLWLTYVDSFRGMSRSKLALEFQWRNNSHSHFRPH